MDIRQTAEWEDPFLTTTLLACPPAQIEKSSPHALKQLAQRGIDLLQDLLHTSSKVCRCAEWLQRWSLVRIDLHIPGTQRGELQPLTAPGMPAADQRDQLALDQCVEGHALPGCEIQTAQLTPAVRAIIGHTGSTRQLPALCNKIKKDLVDCLACLKPCCLTRSPCCFASSAIRVAYLALKAGAIQISPGNADPHAGNQGTIPAEQALDCGLGCRALAGVQIERRTHLAHGLR